MRPAAVVGVTTSLDPGPRLRLRANVEYAYLKRSYGRAVAAAGGVPILLTPEVGVERALALCDALVVSGGDDLPAAAPADGSWPAPAAAGATPEQPERIEWERGLIDGFLSRGRPLLGVCYGMQLLNLHFGGTLVEDLPAQRPGELDHGGGGRFTEHALSAVRDHPAVTPLGDAACVSSCHRQAVDRVAAGFEVVAEAPDGVVEAIARGAALGVEWHPEADASAATVYGWLVARAGGAR